MAVNKKPAFSNAQIQHITSRIKKSDAPVVTQENYRVDLLKALSHYNSTVDDKTFASTVLSYVKKNDKNKANVLSKAPNWEFGSTGKLLLIRNEGGYLSDEHAAFIDTKINDIYERYKDIKQKEDVVDDPAPKAPVISIEQRIIEAAGKQSEEIDYAIDAFLTNKKEFSTKSYIIANGISGAVCKKIGESYKPKLAELEEAIKGEDEQLVEGYSFLSKSELKRFRDFIASIINDCENAVLVAKASRAPRVRKPKPAAKQVAKMKYLNEYPDLNLKSVHPTKIVGAQQLWVFNTKNNKLGVYYATGASGFSVKGSSLLGWDPETSSQNRLRKPADVIAKVLDGGKLVLNKILSSLTTINTKMNGRFNADTIILRVL